MSGPSSPNIGDSRKYVKTKLCRYFERQACQRGSDCRWAHGEDELRPAPQMEEKKSCRRFPVGKCNKGANCPFAHEFTHLNQPKNSIGSLIRLTNWDSIAETIAFGVRHAIEEFNVKNNSIRCSNLDKTLKHSCCINHQHHHSHNHVPCLTHTCNCIPCTKDKKSSMSDLHLPENVVCTILDKNEPHKELQNTIVNNLSLLNASLAPLSSVIFQTISKNMSEANSNVTLPLPDNTQKKLLPLQPQLGNNKHKLSNKAIDEVAKFRSRRIGEVLETAAEHTERDALNDFSAVSLAMRHSNLISSSSSSLYEDISIAKLNDDKLISTKASCDLNTVKVIRPTLNINANDAANYINNPINNNSNNYINNTNNHPNINSNNNNNNHSHVVEKKLNNAIKSVSAVNNRHSESFNLNNINTSSNNNQTSQTSCTSPGRLESQSLAPHNSNNNNNNNNCNNTSVNNITRSPLHSPPLHRSQNPFPPLSDHTLSFPSTASPFASNLNETPSPGDIDLDDHENDEAEISEDPGFDINAYSVKHRDNYRANLKATVTSEKVSSSSTTIKILQEHARVITAAVIGVDGEQIKYIQGLQSSPSVQINNLDLFVLNNKIEQQQYDSSSGLHNNTTITAIANNNNKPNSINININNAFLDHQNIETSPALVSHSSFPCSPDFSNINIFTNGADVKITDNQMVEIPSLNQNGGEVKVIRHQNDNSFNATDDFSNRCCYCCCCCQSCEILNKNKKNNTDNKFMNVMFLNNDRPDRIQCPSSSSSSSVLISLKNAKNSNLGDLNICNSHFHNNENNNIDRSNIKYKKEINSSSSPSLSSSLLSSVSSSSSSSVSSSSFSSSSSSANSSSSSSSSSYTSSSSSSSPILLRVKINPSDILFPKDHSSDNGDTTKFNNSPSSSTLQTKVVSPISIGENDGTLSMTIETQLFQNTTSLVRLNIVMDCNDEFTSLSQTLISPQLSVHTQQTANGIPRGADLNDTDSHDKKITNNTASSDFISNMYSMNNATD